MWAYKMIAVAKTPPTPRQLGKSLVPTKVDALVAKWQEKPTIPSISTGADGTITIPAAAFSSKNRGASISTLPSSQERVDRSRISNHSNVFMTFV